MIKIDNMNKIQKNSKKYNKIIFKISSINNFTNLKFYNFFVLNPDFGWIQEKIITIYFLQYPHFT